MKEERKRYYWKNKDLYIGDKKIEGIRLEEHSRYRSMYYIVFPDGVISTNFYNLATAKDNIIRYFLGDHLDRP